MNSSLSSRASQPTAATTRSGGALIDFLIAARVWPSPWRADPKLRRPLRRCATSDSVLAGSAGDLAGEVASWPLSDDFGDDSGR